jgi:hypothetical protein
MMDAAIRYSSFPNWAPASAGVVVEGGIFRTENRSVQNSFTSRQPFHILRINRITPPRVTQS